MGNGDVATMFQSEQDAFASLIHDLTPEQWELRSLCPEWTVRDVVVHAAFHSHRAGMKETLGSTEKYTALMVEREHVETIDDLIAWFESPAPASARRLKINVCELVIHQQDVVGLLERLVTIRRRRCGCASTAVAAWRAMSSLSVASAD